VRESKSKKKLMMKKRGCYAHLFSVWEESSRYHKNSPLYPIDARIFLLKEQRKKETLQEDTEKSWESKYNNEVSEATKRRERHKTYDKNNDKTCSLFFN